MRFSSWYFAFLLVLLPLLYRWWVRRNKPASVLFPLPVPGSAGSRNPVRWLVLLRVAALAILVIALMRPQESFRIKERTVSGLDIILVMDVSASMNIEDLSEQPRFEIAKATMRDFVRGRQDDRIGFVIFSGEAFTMAPPTLDYGLVLSSIRDARIGDLKDGTAIGDGLALAVSRLKDSKAKSRVVILLTDGDNNVGQVDPATAGELAKGYGIRVYTIAIGREGRVRMPIRHQGVFGQTVTTYQWFENALNPELLQQIAAATNAKFYRVTDANTLDSVFREIDRLEKSDVKSNERVRYEERFHQPLKLGFVLLAFERILASGWWRLIL